MGQQIRERMEVLGSDGQHVGYVDRVDDEGRIKLTKKDPDADGLHHYIPMAWVERVDNNDVHLNKTSHEAQRELKPGAL